MSSNTAAGPLPAQRVNTNQVAIWAVILIAGVALALAGQYLLDGLADQNQTWHWMQHATLFWAGLMAGASVLRLYQLGGRSA